MPFAECIDFGDPGTPLPNAVTMVLWDSSHAYHKLGGIGRPEVAGRTEFIYVRSEKPGFLVGNFCEGLAVQLLGHDASTTEHLTIVVDGFMNVHFPREACREVTAEEEAWLSRYKVVIV